MQKRVVDLLMKMRTSNRDKNTDLVGVLNCLLNGEQNLRKLQTKMIGEGK